MRAPGFKGAHLLYKRSETEAIRMRHVLLILYWSFAMSSEFLDTDGIPKSDFVC